MQLVLVIIISRTGNYFGETKAEQQHGQFMLHKPFTVSVSDKLIRSVCNSLKTKSNDKLFI